MSLDSSADYSTLKDAVLEMWIPVVGAKTADGWLRKNFLKHFCYYYYPQVETIPSGCEEAIEGLFAAVCDRWVFKTNLESYFDIQPPFQLSEPILTGSLSEGLFLYSTEPPDMDFMCVLKNIAFSQEDQENGSLVLREDTPFVYAFVKNKEAQELWGEFFDNEDTQAGKHRLSSRKLKEKLHENYQKTGKIFRNSGKEEVEEIKEGAAVAIRKTKPIVSMHEAFAKIMDQWLRKPLREIDQPNLLKYSDQIMHDVLYTLVPYIDIVLSIFCDEWPSCAREWITRERVWPEIHAVQKITHNGFHIVPKSSRDGDFRLSFSCAETMLIQILSPLQLRVMRAFKAVIKYHQSIWSSTFDEIISSYHLKTIAFWHFEKSPQKHWTEETLVHHLLTLLGDLAEALTVQHLPMYFMPKVNLLQDFDDPEVMLGLVDKISQLSQNFSAICDAVNNSSTLKFYLALATESERDNIEKIMDTMYAEMLHEADDGGEISSSLFGRFMEKFVKNL